MTHHQFNTMPALPWLKAAVSVELPELPDCPGCPTQALPFGVSFKYFFSFFCRFFDILLFSYLTTCVRMNAAASWFCFVLTPPALPPSPSPCRHAFPPLSMCTDFHVLYLRFILWIWSDSVYGLPSLCGPLAFRRKNQYICVPISWERMVIHVSLLTRGV